MKLDLMKSSIASKQELQIAANDEAQKMLDEGFGDPIKILIHGRRIVEFVNTYNKVIESKVRAEVDLQGGKIIQDGATLVLRGTGERLDYQQDEIYQELLKKLKDRESLLKTAFKMDDPIYDSEGIEVMKVGLKSASKETLAVSF